VFGATLAQSADEVTLRFANGQDSISGLLTDFKEDRFFLEASIGMVVIPADGASCIDLPRRHALGDRKRQRCSDFY